MGNFNRDRGFDRGDRGGFRGNKGGYGNKRSFDRPQVQMHQATCDDCGKSCEVPFRPTGEKPVYCRDCFDKRGDRANTRDFGNNRDFGNRDFGSRDNGFRSERREDFNKEMFTATCDNCGKKCEVPFRPSGDKPVYCSDCFRKDGSRDERRGDRASVAGNATNPELVEQLKAMNAKLDRLLRALELRSDAAAPKAMVFEPEAEVAPQKKAKKVVAKVETKTKAVAKPKAKAKAKITKTKK